MEFYAWLKNGHIFKVLVELIKNYVTDVCLELTEEGIYICTLGRTEYIMIDCFLNSIGFNKYVLVKPRIIGINFVSLHNTLRNLRKKESVAFFISSEMKESTFGITIKSSVSKSSTVYMKLQNIVKHKVQLPVDYTRPQIISTVGFREMCKNVKQTNQKIKIELDHMYVRFKCKGSNNLYCTFDEFERSDVYYSNTDYIFMHNNPLSQTTSRNKGCIKPDHKKTSKKGSQLEYGEYFETESINDLSRLHGLSDNMKIYLNSKIKTLKISVDIQGLGYASFYIEPISRMEELMKKSSEQEGESDAEFDDNMGCILSDEDFDILDSSCDTNKDMIKYTPMNEILTCKKKKPIPKFQGKSKRKITKKK